MSNDNVVKLYSNGCPRCAILKNTLDNLKIPYVVIDDMQKVIDAGFKTIPILEVDGEMMTYAAAMKWCNQRGK